MMCRVAVIIWILQGAVAGVRAGQILPGVPAQSIESFNQLKALWPERVGRLFRVEGRCALIGKDLLIFKKCDLSFRSRDDFPRLTRDSRTVEVVGRLAVENGRLYFAVEELTELPSDMEQFRKRRSDLKDGEPEDWYALGDWAMQRGRFYNDDDLTAEALTAYRSGIELERSRIRGKTPDGLFKLAQKADGYHLPSMFQLELVHEGCYRLWQRSQAEGADADAPQQVARTIAQKLPNATTRLLRLEPELRAKYLEDPLEFYQRAGSEQRKILHRILYNEIVLTAIENRAAQDGSNGIAIAEQIDAQLPEYSELARSYRERGIAFRFAHIETASRTDAIGLAKRLEQQEQPERAKALLHRWLEAREKILRPEGPDGLRQLANDYQTLTKDSQKAAELLMEAYEHSDGAPEVGEELERLGYVFSNGRWMTVQEFSGSPDGEIAIAMREGRVIKQMTAAQVRQTLGKPSSIARSATDGEFAETWIYGANAATPLAIHLARRLSAPELTVIGVSQLTAR